MIMSKWFYILMIFCAVAYPLCNALEKIFKDPVAQQIDACSSSCRYKMISYDADKKLCECQKEEKKEK
jgi:hypothetical protein